MLIQRLAGRPIVCVFFFNDTATTEIYTLSLHDALPILLRRPDGELRRSALEALGIRGLDAPPPHLPREDLLAELQALLVLLAPDPLPDLAAPPGGLPEGQPLAGRLGLRAGHHLLRVAVFQRAVQGRDSAVQSGAPT